MTGLRTLSCTNNQLTELGLSAVTGLGSLACTNNQFTELDIRPILSVGYVRCSDKVNVKKFPKQRYNHKPYA